MKFLTLKTKQFASFLMLMFFSVIAFAQNSTPDLRPATDAVTTTTTTTTETWYSNPLYWIIGALLVIVLIAAVARGGRRD